MDNYYYNSNFQYLPCYYPHRLCIIAMPLFILIFTVCIFIAGCVVNEDGMECFLHLPIYGYLCAAVLSALSGKYIYSLMQQCLICTDRGIYVLNDGKFTLDLIEWDAPLYVYRGIDCKGFYCYVFSKREMSKWMVQDYIKQGYWRELLHVGGVIVARKGPSTKDNEFWQEVQKHTSIQNYG